MGKRRLNNTGSVFYRSDRDAWVYAVVVDGKRKTVSAKTQKELSRKILKFEQEIYNEKIEKNNISLEQLMLELNDLKHELNIIKANTYHRRNETIKMTKTLSYKSVQDIKTSDLLDFYKLITIKYSNSTISKIKHVLDEAFEEAIKRNLVEKNIIKELPVPRSRKQEKEIRAFTIEEQKRFLEVISSSRYCLVYLIAINTGMRTGEVLALHKKDIDLNNNIIKVNKTVTRDATGRAVLGNETKTKKGIRNVFIHSEQLKQEIKEHIDKIDTEALFVRDNHFISTNAISSEMKRLNKKYNITEYNVHSHMLRHTFATRCIEGGMPAVVLAKILGHSDISTTLNTYTSVFEDFQKKSLENINGYLQKIFGN